LKDLLKRPKKWDFGLGTSKRRHSRPKEFYEPLVVSIYLLISVFSLAYEEFHFEVAESCRIEDVKQKRKQSQSKKELKKMKMNFKK
jgi:hypothetical protein